MVKELKVAAAGLQHVLPASSCRMRSRARSRPGACAGEAGPPQLSSPDPASSEHTLLVMLWGLLTCLGPACLAKHFRRGSPPWWEKQALLFGGWGWVRGDVSLITVDQGKFKETKGKVYQGLGERDVESYCLLDTEFLFRLMEKC